MFFVGTSMALQFDMQSARKKIGQTIEKAPGICHWIMRVILGKVQAGGQQVSERTFIPAGETV